MMSKSALIIGLVLSAVIHIALLWPADTSQLRAQDALRSVSVMAMPTAVEPPTEPEVQPEPEPVTEVAPEPPPVEVEAPEPEPLDMHNPPAAHPQTDPSPLEPIVSAPPLPVRPSQEESAQGLRTAHDGPGDFTGESAAAAVPAVWIDWGTPTEARDVLAVGQMPLVVLEPDETIRHVVDLSGPTPTINIWNPGREARYSNRLRIVDHVNAFASIATQMNLSGGRHLAVLFPMRIDQQIDAAQRRAAYDEDLDMEEIRGFAGSFTLVGNAAASRTGQGVLFTITHVQRR